MVKGFRAKAICWISGVANNIVEKSGSWFSYKGDRIGQGRENVRQFLKDNPDIRANIDTELRRALGLTKSPEAETPSPNPTPIDTAKQTVAGRGR